MPDDDGAAGAGGGETIVSPSQPVVDEADRVIGRVGELELNRPGMRTARDAIRLCWIGGVPEMVLFRAGDTAPPNPSGSNTGLSLAAGAASRARIVVDAALSDDGPLVQTVTRFFDDDRVPAADEQRSTRRWNELFRAHFFPQEHKSHSSLVERARWLIKRELRSKRLDQLYDWQRSAALEMSKLRAVYSHTAQDANPDKRARLIDAGRVLSIEMSKNSSHIALLEASRRAWELARTAAAQAISLRTESAKSFPGEPLLPEPRLHLQLAHATFMCDGNTPELRRDLKSARQTAPDSRMLTYYETRCLIMAGDFRQATTVLEAAPEEVRADPRIHDEIRSKLELRMAAAPHKVHPSNYYSYRATFVERARLDDLIFEVAALSTAQQLPEGIDVPERIVSLQAAVEHAAARAAEYEEVLSARYMEQEERRARAGIWKFEDENGNPRRETSASSASGRASSNAEDKMKRLRSAIASAAKELSDERAEFLEEVKKAASIAKLALDTLLAWDRATGEMQRGRWASAIDSYVECQQRGLIYLSKRHTTIFPPNFTVNEERSKLIVQIRDWSRNLNRELPRIATHFRRRLGSIDLDGLFRMDWLEPILPVAENVYRDAASMVSPLLFRPEIADDKIDAPILTLISVFAHMGLAEAYASRRQYFYADGYFSDLVHKSMPNSQNPFASEFIEGVFVLILRARMLLQMADGEYKRGDFAAATAGYEVVLDHISSSQLASGYSEEIKQASTRWDATADQCLGQIVIDPITGATSLTGANLHPLATAESSPDIAPLLNLKGREVLALLGTDPQITGITAQRGPAPGVARDVNPHEALLIFSPPNLKETNPTLWALVSEATARLRQIRAGLNFYGYRKGYVPSLRFHYYLDRARYFTEQAKAGERDYISFASRADEEDYRLLSMSQLVTLEKGNIRLEDARVEQARLEAEVANQAKGLADLVERNAIRRHGNYMTFENRTNFLRQQEEDFIFLRGAFSTVLGGGEEAGRGGGAGGAVLGAVKGIASYFFEQGKFDISFGQVVEQHALERKNLRLAIEEAHHGAQVSAAELNAAKQRLGVATTQRAVALLRHEFAVENLLALQQRNLNADNWYRLAQLLQGIGKTYLAMAIELAYLAQEAYVFEANKQVDVVRLDYEHNELSGMLASDFLLRDLNTLEHEYIVARRLRQQHIRYVISLAREHPDAFQNLRSNGTAIFTIPLEQLERRFPGMYNLRVGSLEVTPVALMDPTRFGLYLTYMGSSQIRLRIPPEAAPGVQLQSWLPAADTIWPVRTQLFDPESAVFSRLTGAEERATFTISLTQQRNAFEGLGAASSWHIDLSLPENRIVPGSLVDLLFVMDLSGYHDPALQQIIGATAAQRQSVTQYFYGRTTYTDAFYEFNQTGTMTWNVSNSMLESNGQPGPLRNIGVLIRPAVQRVHFGRWMSHHVLEYTVTAAGELVIDVEAPHVTFTIDKLRVQAEVEVPPATTVFWDFGDGTEPVQGLRGDHSYGKPGRYEVKVTFVTGRRYSEARGAVVVSRKHKVAVPLTTYPILSLSADGIVAKAAGRETNVTVMWHFDGGIVFNSNEAVVAATSGRHVVSFTAWRDLEVEIYGRQAHQRNKTLTLKGTGIATNREFDDSGNETEASIAGQNGLSQHIFGGSFVGPVDNWSFSIVSSSAHFFHEVNTNDELQVNLSEVEDVALLLDYDLING